MLLLLVYITFKCRIENDKMVSTFQTDEVMKNHRHEHSSFIHDEVNNEQKY